MSVKEAVWNNKFVSNLSMHNLVFIDNAKNLS